MDIKLSCPKCLEGTMTIGYDPGAPGRSYMANGDPGYPPEPACIDNLDADCECWSEAEINAIFDDICQHCGQAVTAHVNGEANVPFSDKLCKLVAGQHFAGVTHPVYTMLECVVSAVLGIESYYTESAMAAYFNQRFCANCDRLISDDVVGEICSACVAVGHPQIIGDKFVD